MACGIWRGVNGVARKVTKEWRGVGNVVRKVKAEWRGVGNVARKVYQAIWVLYDNGSNNAGLQAYNVYGHQDSNYTSFESDHIWMTYSYDDGTIGYGVFKPSASGTLSGFTKMYVDATWTTYYSDFKYLNIYLNDVRCAENPTIVKNTRTVYEFTIPESVKGSVLEQFEILNDNNHYIGTAIRGKIHKIWFE